MVAVGFVVALGAAMTPYDFVDHWQTLIAGGLGLAAGVIAYIGAISAAKRQINEMRQQVAAMRETTSQQIAAMREATERQVAAVQRQLEDVQAARAETDRHRLGVIEWAVRAEGERLKVTAYSRRAALSYEESRRMLTKEQLLIESSPLLRGEREDGYVLDDHLRSGLVILSSSVNNYDAYIETHKAVGMILSESEAKEVIGHVIQQIEAIWPSAISPPPA
jgi:hypothetical protein